MKPEDRDIRVVSDTIRYGQFVKHPDLYFRWHWWAKVVAVILVTVDPWASAQVQCRPGSKAAQRYCK